jgi:hypothetical protein
LNRVLVSQTWRCSPHPSHRNINPPITQIEVISDCQLPILRIFASRYLDRKTGNWQSEIGNDLNLRIKTLYNHTLPEQNIRASKIPASPHVKAKP